MPVLKQLIPQQRFEVIRDRLAVILMDELTAQYEFHQNKKWLPTAACIERTITFDKTMLPIINISVGSGAYSNKDITQVDGAYQFYVDVYANSPSTDEGKADTLSAINMQRILGMCRAILENPSYCTLGYQPPFNNSIKVLSISFGEATDSDALTTTVGRLIVEVSIPETVELVNPIPLSVSNTQVKLYSTQIGHLYTTEAVIDSNIFTNEFTDEFA